MAAGVRQPPLGEPDRPVRHHRGAPRLVALGAKPGVSFTKRLAPRPLGCEPLSVVTVTGSERVSFPAASMTEAWTVWRPLGIVAVSKTNVFDVAGGQGRGVVNGRRQFAACGSGGWLRAVRPSTTMPTRSTPPPRSLASNEIVFVPRAAPLSAVAPLEGTKTISFDASDRGGGVKRVGIVIDGRTG